jgi:hypothetical protein
MLLSVAMADQKVFTFNLKGKETPHHVVGATVQDNGLGVSIKDKDGRTIARFAWSELQGWSEENRVSTRSRSDQKHRRKP